MEINEDGFIEKDKLHPKMQIDRDELIVSSNVFLDHVGEVILSINSDELSWKLVESADNEGRFQSSSCLGIKLASKVETEIKISDVYAVEFKNWGLIHESVTPNARASLLGRDSEMYRFTVHGFQRSNTKCSLWVLATYTFGHMDLQTCQTWVDKISSFINKEVGRPKSLLVFVHPLSGKGNGSRTWETVAPIFSRAKVKTKVTVTERAGHAFDVMASISDKELNSYDGVVAVGGDGFFNEILNGLLSSRHKAPYPPNPVEVTDSAGNNGNASVADPNETPDASPQYREQDPLLQSSEPCRTGYQILLITYSCSYENHADEGTSFPLPNERFRLGIIPSGSTDAIVICTTGARDPVTSALQIVLGRSVCLDIAQVVRWKTTSSSKDAPCVRYAASFAGYGFYGDVIKESENYRWMGPKRYDYAGTKVFLRHRSYEAEVAYLEVKTEKLEPPPKKALLDSRTQPLWRSWVPPKKPEREVCRKNCHICNESFKTNHVITHSPTITHQTNVEDSKWLRSKGRFLSIGAAVISCRNERAPDGLVADAHLADGLLDLILIKDCPRAFYLWHLTQLAKKGGDPLNFEFVEHFKTPAFTFTSFGEESIWNLDGELFQAHQLSAQIFRGLVTLFASGPEV
ncbi:Diacylglycerol kinase [Macleaya cordata]|uniref:Diacylglycerol kinase n=1 Tax=Macleaya cordata TaxID=56857 RepID=A0A200Q5D1_MACCD|nr:Diacylglycerol kinase [Macleaya cordata]